MQRQLSLTAMTMFGFPRGEVWEPFFFKKKKKKFAGFSPFNVLFWSGNAVAAFTSNGIPLPGSPYAVKGTWGISLDGRDNLYLAGFGAPETFDGHSITYMCGAGSAECSPGQILSFPEGWGRYNKVLSKKLHACLQSNIFFKAYQRLVDVQTAQSGAVWASNNWLRQPTPQNARMFLTFWMISFFFLFFL